MKQTKYLSATLIVLLALLCYADNLWATQKPLKKALRGIEDTIEEVRDDSKSCRKALLSELKDLRDELEEILDQQRGKKIRQLNRDLGDLRDIAEEKCNKRVNKELRRVRNYLDDAEDVVDYRDKDDRDREERDKYKPLSSLEFSNLLEELEKAPKDRKRLGLLKATLKKRFLTSIELGFILDTFKKEKNQVKVIEICATLLSDPQNAVLLPLIFSDPDNQSRASQIIGSVQR